MAPCKCQSMADPNCKHCPDFVLPEFEDERLIFTVDGKIDEEAIKVLRALWVINHNRDIENWDHQHEAQAVEERLQLEQTKFKAQQQHTHLLKEEEEAKKEEKKKYKNKFVLILDRPLLATVLLLLSQHALTKL